MCEDTSETGPIGNTTKDPKFPFPKIKPTGTTQTLMARPLRPYADTIDYETTSQQLARSMQEALQKLGSYGIRVAPHTLIVERFTDQELKSIIHDGRKLSAHAIVEYIEGSNIEKLLQHLDPKAIQVSLDLINRLISYLNENSTFLSEIFTPSQYVLDKQSQTAVLVDIDPVIAEIEGDKIFAADRLQTYMFFREGAVLSLLQWLEICNLPRNHPLFERLRKSFPGIIQSLEKRAELTKKDRQIIS